VKRELGRVPFHSDFLHVSRFTPHVSLAGVRRGYSAIRCKSVFICVHLWLNLKTAVNAKMPRGKGARDRKMTREKQVYITHPVGDSPQQPKPLRLCTFAPLRWFNCFFQVETFTKFGDHSSAVGGGCGANSTQIPRSKTEIRRKSEGRARFILPSSFFLLHSPH